VTGALSADARPLSIGFLSRIHPKKGLDLLIEALSVVGFRYRLRIAGESESTYLATLKRLASDRGIDSNIEWVGWQNEKEKFPFLAELDLLALTSHNENFAITVIEALSVGTPVLISDRVGICDYVLQNDLGWVSDLTIESIVENLEAADRDASKREKIRRTAPVLVRRDYDDSHLAGRYIQFYEELKRA